MTKKIERRIVADAHIEVRTNAGGTIGLRGYAAIFDSPAHGEVVKRSAFNRTLAQGDNCRLLVNHDGVPLASIKAGTMTLSVDERGLLVDAPSLDPANPTVQELVSAMSRGDIDQMSFAFSASDCPVISGVRELREVRLYDVSVVTFPWYEDTTVSLTGDRSVDRELVSIRSLAEHVDVTAEQRATAVRALRMAPPGKVSWSDVEMALWEAIEGFLNDAWIYICEMGSDWAVYRVLDRESYEYGPYQQISWKQNADGTFKLGTPFEVKPEFNPVEPSTDPVVRDNPVDPPVVERAGHTVAEARALLGLSTAA